MRLGVLTAVPVAVPGATSSTLHRGSGGGLALTDASATSTSAITGGTAWVVASVHGSRSVALASLCA